MCAGFMLLLSGFAQKQDCGNLTCAEATEKRSAQDVTDQSKALFLMKNIGRSEASVGSERIC